MYTLDQSFSSNNLRKIFDYENRKGNYLEGKFFSKKGEFFPEIEEITRKLKQCSSEFKELKKNKGSLSDQEYETQKIRLNETKEELKEEKEILLTTAFEKISKKITDNSFKIELKKIQQESTKVVYTTKEKDAATYFALKQVQYNIKKLYKVKQSNRYNILCQLKNLLNDKFPKYVIRTDIKDFFETIPHNKIKQKINCDPLLTASSKKIITQILSEYTRLSGNDNGIPRGIGISSYLAELYMRSIDDKIRFQKNVIYYARYVDDIIVIYTPQPNLDISNLLKDLTTCIIDNGLTVNKKKTESFDLMEPQNATLEYLGYKMSFGTGTVKLELTNNKIEKYKRYLSMSFDAYHKTSKFNEQKARKLLVKRIKFLTSNTRLLNNKKDTIVGVYFSNSLLTGFKKFTELDDYLKNEISKISSTNLTERLKKLSFTEGFLKQKYASFTAAELKKITMVWKHVF